MNHLTSILVILLFISLVPCQSNASLKYDQISSPPNPSPSPSPSLSPIPIEQAKSETCNMVSNKCQIAGYNITACVPSLREGFGGLYMLVINDFKSSLELNIVVHPMNKILENLVIPGQQITKVNLPPNVEGMYSILLSTRKGHCMIHLKDEEQLGFHTKHFTPTSGPYLLFATGLLVAVVWSCCTLRKRVRRVDQVTYQELEMGCHQDSKSSSSVGMMEHCDQSWVEDWDDKEVPKRSPRVSHIGKRLRKGLRHIDSD